MTALDATTVALVERVRCHDQSAVSQLLQLHRPRLKRVIGARLDRRMSARLDPSDVVQDVFLEATRRLPEFLRDEKMPFFLWLRAIALSRLIDLHRRHTADKRSIEREMAPPPLSEESLADFAACLAALQSTPSQRAMGRERCERVRLALERLPPAARELLVLRYIEDLSPGEIAALLQTPERTVRRHHREALVQLGQLLNEPGDLS